MRQEKMLGKPNRIKKAVEISEKFYIDCKYYVDGVQLRWPKLPEGMDKGIRLPGNMETEIMIEYVSGEEVDGGTGGGVEDLK